MKKRQNIKIIISSLLIFIVSLSIINIISVNAFNDNLISINDFSITKNIVNDCTFSNIQVTPIKGKLPIITITEINTQLEGITISSNCYDVNKGKELEFIINKNPHADMLQFPCKMGELNYYKQLPLDEELDLSIYEFVNETTAINNTQIINYRPENIVNGYTVYDGEQKIFNIYRIKIIDSSNNTIYCDQTIEDDIWTIYLNQEWLNNATYPIIVDPLFGYDTIGSSQFNNWNGYPARGSRFYLPIDANITTVNFYINNLYASTYGCMIFNDSDGSLVTPYYKVINIGAVSNITGWISKNTTSQVFLPTNYYWLTVLNVDGNNYWSYYDSGATNQGYVGGEYYNYSFSIYANFNNETEIPTATPTATATATPTATPTTTPTGTPTATPTITVTANSLNFVLLIIFIIINLILCVFSIPEDYPIVNTIVMLFTLVITVIIFLPDNTIPANPYLSGFLGILTVIMLIINVFKTKA
jgi:hypothetical protein